MKIGHSETRMPQDLRYFQCARCPTCRASPGYRFFDNSSTSSFPCPPLPTHLSSGLFSLETLASFPFCSHPPPFPPPHSFLLRTPLPQNSYFLSLLLAPHPPSPTPLPPHSSLLRTPLPQNSCFPLSSRPPPPPPLLSPP